MASSKRFSFAVQEPSSSKSDCGTSQSSDGRLCANGSRFPEERAEIANGVASNSANHNSNAQVFLGDVGENARQKNISRIPLAVWRTKRSSATSTTCRGDAMAAKDGRSKREVSRPPATPATSNSRESDFDSVLSAVFHESDNESAVRWRQQLSYVKPEDRCGRFEWSDYGTTEVRLPQWKFDGGNGDNVANRRTATRPRSDWAAAEKLEQLAAKEDKRIKKQKIIDTYTGGLKQAPSVPVKVGQRTSSYINRKAKERETARINSIMIKKLLNVKSTLPTWR